VPVHADVLHTFRFAGHAGTMRIASHKPTSHYQSEFDHQVL
jgi:hypothetical protein